MSGHLIADIGGTHSRLALAGETIEHITVYDNAAYSGAEAVIQHYLVGLQVKRPTAAALAVAAPLAGDTVSMTNLGWVFSSQALCARFGFREVRLFNDFAAVAMAVPVLTPDDVLCITGGTAQADKPAGVIGPGTGLGVSALVPYGDDWIPVVGEGGHVTLAAATEEEGRIIDTVRREYGHVSAERLLSGPGLTLLYRLLADGDDTSVAPEIITRLAVSAEDAAAVRALDHFLAMLGTVAGNLALTLGAGGGIYLAGGILPSIPELLQRSLFSERFVDKGRYREYLKRIPVFLIKHPHPALAGLQHYVYSN